MEEEISLRQLYDEVANLSVENIKVRVKRLGKNLILAPEVAGLFQPDSNGRLRPLVNTSGEVTETNSSNISGKVTYIVNRGNAPPWGCTADGAVYTGAAGLFPAIPVAITADGTGAVGAAVEVVPAHATLKWDSVFTVQVSVSGLHQLDFVENTAAPAVTVPDYNSAPPDVFLVAGFPYTFRLMNVTANRNLGVNAGAAGYFPNNSVMTITPMSRGVA